MTGVSSHKKYILYKRNQLYWFVNKLISVSKETVCLQNYEELICFPVEFLKEKKDLFPLGRNSGSVGYKSEDEEYGSYCSEMLSHIRNDIYKLEDKYLHFNKEEFGWQEDPGFWGYGYAFFIDAFYKKLFEEYLKYMDSQDTDLKMSDEKLPVLIKTIEVLEDKTELKAVVMYINGDYENSIELSRGMYLKLFYVLARDQEVACKDGLIDYFNSNSDNPLYKRYGFERSKILRKEGNYMKPNIPIILRTQKFISQTKNNASLKSKKLKTT